MAGMHPCAPGIIFQEDGVVFLLLSAFLLVAKELFVNDYGISKSCPQVPEKLCNERFVLTLNLYISGPDILYMKHDANFSYCQLHRH